MPEFLSDWYQWWFTFFNDNLVVFWIMAIAAITFSVATRRLRRRRR